jgi:hypothetical protein
MRVVFPEEKHEKAIQSDSDGESLSDEAEDELENVSDSYIDSSSGSDSHDETDIKKNYGTSDAEYSDSLQKAENSNKYKSNQNSENEGKKQKLKSAVAHAEYKLLHMTDIAIDNSGDEEDEYEEYDSVHDDESSDGVPTKKLKLTIDVKENHPERYITL